MGRITLMKGHPIGIKRIYRICDLLPFFGLKHQKYEFEEVNHGFSAHRHRLALAQPPVRD
jgi:hypothetical protein